MVSCPTRTRNLGLFLMYNTLDFWPASQEGNNCITNVRGKCSNIYTVVKKLHDLYEKKEQQLDYIRGQNGALSTSFRFSEKPLHIAAI